MAKLKYLSDKDNRTWHLLKRKSWQDDEFLITGFSLTTGDLGEEGFQLNLVTSSGKPFNSGTGLTASDRQYYAEHSPVGKKAKIKFLVYSTEGIPQNNTILAIL